jgi:23S rRNA pseudouridine1911/1915/1917 synthase
MFEKMARRAGREARAMPSKNMLPKGQRRRSVKAEYRATRGVETPTETVVPELDLDVDTDVEDGVRTFAADAAAVGMRLDAYLAQAIPEISRARVQLLIEAGQVRVNGEAAKGKQKLRGGEAIEIAGEPRPTPLHATAENIPLDILYEDKYLAVVNKPAGMMVHAGAGAGDEGRNRGTLVNALLHHMGKPENLSGVGGELRPGIVHRLDKQTSGAIVVAKDDVTHRKLGEMFAARRVAKTYIALVHGNLAKDQITVNLPIARDLVRRTRMTTRRGDGRSAVSHIKVLEQLATRYGAFTLVEVRIETGRTHQIRVHMQSLGHPVVGDTLYGAPRLIPPVSRIGGAERPTREESLGLERNFLHAAHLEFAHPQTGKTVAVDAPLPPELEELMAQLRTGRVS